MNKQPYQFSLQALLRVTTIIACVMGFLMMLPTGLRFFLMSCLVLLGLSVCLYWSVKIADQAAQRFLVSRRVQPRQDEYPYSLLAAFQKAEREKSILPPAKGSKRLTSLSLVVIVAVLLTTALQLPGIEGSAQNTGEPSELGQFIHLLRVATMLLLMAAPVLYGIHGLSRFGKRESSRIGWVILGTASYFLAWKVVVYFRFFPTV